MLVHFGCSVGLSSGAAWRKGIGYWKNQRMRSGELKEFLLTYKLVSVCVWFVSEYPLDITVY